MNAQSAKKLLTSYAWITVGSLLYALAFDWFYAPNQIALGGITGLGQAIHTYIPFLSVGLFVLLVNIPLFLLGWRFIGGHLLASSLYAMALSSVAMDGLNLLFPFPATDPMLAAVCGGALLGLAAGLIFSKGATTGGTDLIARLLKLALPWLSMGKVLLAVDVSALLLVMVSPIKALVFLVFLVVLQQIEGNVIYPKVVGTSIGLPGIWVLAAVSIGGSLMGVVGMLIFIPIVSVAYALFREIVYLKLKKQGVDPAELED